MFYVYILKSEHDGNLYTGSTNDLKRRMAEHENGEVDSTKHRRPLKLVYYEAYKNETDARLRESRLKNSGNAMGQLKRRIGNCIN